MRPNLMFDAGSNDPPSIREKYKNTKNRVIIAGSRTINENDAPLLAKISNILANMSVGELCIVSGKARGKNWAKMNNIPIVPFPADWDKFSKRAGMIRNKQMAEYSTHCIAILDSEAENKGTKSMIKLAEEYKLKLRVITV